MIHSTRLRNLDLGTLRSFVTIAELGSMTRAASRLFMTQSAISMQIKRLEAVLEASVFERSGKGMMPTSLGEQLLGFAKQMLALNDETLRRLTSSDYEGQIRFGVPSDIIYPLIPGILREFNRDYPRVQIHFSSARSSELRKQFNQGLQDVILTTERSPADGGQVLSTQPLIWVGAEGGCAWKKRPFPLGTSKNCGFRSSVTKALANAGIAWIDVVNSDDVITGGAMTIADLCVTAELEGPIHFQRVPVDHGGQLPDLPQFVIVLYYADNASDPITQALVGYLQKAYA